MDARTLKKTNKSYFIIKYTSKTLRPQYTRLKVLLALPKNCWLTLLGFVVTQLYAGECTVSAGLINMPVDRVLNG